MKKTKITKILTKLSQYTRMARHFRSLVQHGTPRKFTNLVRTELERRLRRIEVKGRPYILFLDPCNYCNLRCPLCPTGMNELGRESSMLSFEDFKHYFDPHAPYLFEVILHNWGESLINKEVYKMIEYAQSRNVGTNLSSNFSVLKPDDIERLLDSGLEYLIISLDGTDQESYNQYRVRGNFDRVIENVKLLLERRNARGQKLPVIEWQFIVMKHNEHQIEEAEEMAKELGVDLLRFIPVGLPFHVKNRKELQEKWYPTSAQGRVEIDTQDLGTQTNGQGKAAKEKAEPACFYLYRSMAINPDGGVSPCCIVDNSKLDFAQLSTDSEVDIEGIWNNEKFRSGRALFSPKDIPGRKRTACDICPYFTRHPSKAIKPRQVAVPSTSFKT